VRMLILAIVRGGVSLGAFGSVSAKGLISFGSSTVTSNLHQETYAGLSERTISGFGETYPFIFDMRLLYLQPTGSHDLAFQDEKFKCGCIGSEYSRKGRARDVCRNLRL
jgi:hypothetical protein